MRCQAKPFIYFQKSIFSQVVLFPRDWIIRLSFNCLIVFKFYFYLFSEIPISFNLVSIFIILIHIHISFSWACNLFKLLLLIKIQTFFLLLKMNIKAHSVRRPSLSTGLAVHVVRYLHESFRANSGHPARNPFEIQSWN